nr:plastid division protein CDP1, chloroplastic [Ipomoea batatas]
MAISHQTTSAFYFCYAGGDSGRAYCCNAVPFRFGYSVRRRRLVVVSRRRLLATDLRVGVAETTAADRNDAAASSSVVVPSIEIPVTCYQILGVSNKAEKDEIVKSVMHLKNADVEEGYTMDAVISRQNLLMDVRDKLLFEPEYAGNIKEKVPPRPFIRIPWAWLPGALCLLQEVGEEKLVLDIGQKALQHPDSKPYIHDLLLSMALAECAIAKLGFEKNNISQGFEALARAQCLLRSKVSLGKMTLLSQIEESLEELAPACTLELLGMPHRPENAERRLGAISALRELLRQGLDVESSCQVEDWPCFLSQAFSRLMASEIVELLQWDNLALTRKNKKSLESQNQRGVIDFNGFYVVLMAHIALGFSSKQTDLINRAKIICECLIASEGVNLKFEEAFCLFLLGQADEATAAERLRQLEQNSNVGSSEINPIKELANASSENKPLETWLKDAVLSLFPDTRDCSPSLANFFRGEKRTPLFKEHKRVSQTSSHMNHRPIAPAISQDRRALGETVPCADSSRHLGQAVKQLAPPNLQGPMIVDKVNGPTNGTPSIQLKRNLGARQHEIQEILNGILGKIIVVACFGCILFVSFKIMNMASWRVGHRTRWRLSTPRVTSSTSWMADGSQNPRSRHAKRSSIARNLKKLLSNLRLSVIQHQEDTVLEGSCHAASLSSSMKAAYKMAMPAEEAESLVKKWQTIKAEALGPDHHVDALFDVLDESMLVQVSCIDSLGAAVSLIHILKLSAIFQFIYFPFLHYQM